jgi:hypothetical protein
MIFAVSLEIIIQRVVGNKPCYVIKNSLIITVLYNRSRKSNLFHGAEKLLFRRTILIYFIFLNLDFVVLLVED